MKLFLLNYFTSTFFGQQTNPFFQGKRMRHGKLKNDASCRKRKWSVPCSHWNGWHAASSASVFRHFSITHGRQRVLNTATNSRTAFETADTIDFICKYQKKCASFKETLLLYHTMVSTTVVRQNLHTFISDESCEEGYMCTFWHVHCEPPSWTTRRKIKAWSRQLARHRQMFSRCVHARFNDLRLKHYKMKG